MNNAGPIPPEKMKKFLEVAGAIRIMRDKQLYREKFTSFGAYCLAEIGLPEESVSALLAEADLEAALRKANLSMQ
jgi:hypothetical protein